jgi:hypothetical protein
VIQDRHKQTTSRNWRSLSFLDRRILTTFGHRVRICVVNRFTIFSHVLQPVRCTNPTCFQILFFLTKFQPFIWILTISMISIHLTKRPMESMNYQYAISRLIYRWDYEEDDSCSLKVSNYTCLTPNEIVLDQTNAITKISELFSVFFHCPLILYCLHTRFPHTLPNNSLCTLSGIPISWLKSFMKMKTYFILTAEYQTRINKKW